MHYYLVMMMLKNNHMLNFIERFKLFVVVFLMMFLMINMMTPVYGADVKNNEKLKPIKISNPTLDFRVYTRSQEDMAAFYEGRGFSAKLIHSLKDACFFTVIVKNKSNNILWLEPASWPVTLVPGKKAQQLGQQFWRQRWQKLAIAKSSQSTFRWTLLPDSRDLRPDENVGGNYILQATTSKIKLTPVFRIGAKGKTSLRLATQTLQCGAR